MKQAVAISFNWNTQEIMFTDFDGDTAGEDAENWVEKGSFVWRDFPESEGWTHFFHKNPECAKSDCEQILSSLLGLHQ